jgi:hyperosmotically inducible periplasmic protein
VELEHEGKLLRFMRQIVPVIKGGRLMIRIIFAALMLSALTFALVGCDSATEPATSQPKLSNSDLKTAIKTKLDSNAQLKAADIDVDADADKNAATLSGTVESQVLRTRAVEMARAAHAGLVITDKIDVKPRELTRADYTEENAREEKGRAERYGEKLGDSLDDAWIHTKIVAKLIGNADTPERKINIDVVNNAVTLRGTVDSNEQKMEAERVAKETEGVKSVKNMLKVKPA